MKFFRTWRTVINLVLIVDAIVLIFGLYMAFWPMRTLEVKGSDRILNANHQLFAGDALIYQVNYCKYIDRSAVVTRSLVGPVTYPLPASTNNVPTGCNTSISRNTIIPDGIVPGRYRLQSTATYHLNVLRYVSVTHDSEPFQVVLRPVGGTTTVTNTSSSSSTSSSSTPLTPPTPTVLINAEPSSSTATPTPSPKPSLLQQLKNFIF